MGAVSEAGETGVVARVGGVDAVVGLVGVLCEPQEKSIVRPLFKALPIRSLGEVVVAGVVTVALVVAGAVAVAEVGALGAAGGTVVVWVTVALGAGEPVTAGLTLSSLAVFVWISADVSFPLFWVAISPIPRPVTAATRYSIILFSTPWASFGTRP